MRSFTSGLLLALAVSGGAGGCFVDTGAGRTDTRAEATSSGADDTTAAPTTSTSAASMADASTADASTTGPVPPDPTGTTDASSTGTTGMASTTDMTGMTTGAVDPCGDADIDPGEECDNGAVNNGQNGSICKAECTLNTCGVAYLGSHRA